MMLSHAMRMSPALLAARRHGSGAPPARRRPGLVLGHGQPRLPFGASVSRGVLCSATNEYRADALASKTVAQLKELCSQLQLDSRGKKADLIERISTATSAQQPAADASVSPDTSGASEQYANLTVKQLRSILQARGLPVPTRKQDMIARILESDTGSSSSAVPDPTPLQTDSPAAEYSSMRVAELKKLAKERGLPVAAKKADVIAMLQADDAGEAHVPEAQPRKKRGRRKKTADSESILSNTEGRVLLSSKTRDTSKFTRAQLKEYEKAQEDWGNALEESERVTVNQPSAESVAKQAERRKEQEVAAPQLPAVPKKRGDFKIPDTLTHYLVTTMDKATKKTVATIVLNYIKNSMKQGGDEADSKDQDTRAIQEKIRHVDVRALQRTRFIRNEVTGNVKTEQVHYEHGDLLVSCYMTRDIAEMIYSIPATFTTGKAIKGKPAWAPESGDLPQPLSIEQYTDAQQFFIQDIGSDAENEMTDDDEPILVTDEDFENERMKRMLLQIAKRDVLEAKIEVAMGRPAKYTSPYQIHGAQYLLQKDAMSRQKAAYAGALDGADGFSQRASGAAPGSESRPKEKPGRGSRKYDEQDFWEADDGGWYSGGDIVQDQEVSENVRLGGMTNDGRNVYVSKGNTWAPGKDEWLDDDLFDDEFGSQGGGLRNDADSPAKGAASSEAGDFLSWLEETETEDLGLFEEEDVPFANGAAKGGNAGRGWANSNGDADDWESGSTAPARSRQAPSSLAPGAPVEVVDGPFKTLRGTVLELRPKRALFVRLDILGRDTDVELSADSCAPRS